MANLLKGNEDDIEEKRNILHGETNVWKVIRNRNKNLKLMRILN